MGDQNTMANTPNDTAITGAIPMSMPPCSRDAFARLEPERLSNVPSMAETPL